MNREIEKVGLWQNAGEPANLYSSIGLSIYLSMKAPVAEPVEAQAAGAAAPCGSVCGLLQKMLHTEAQRHGGNAPVSITGIVRYGGSKSEFGGGNTALTLILLNGIV
jgi:hypothetical protein